MKMLKKRSPVYIRENENSNQGKAALKKEKFEEKTQKKCGFREQL